MPDASSREAVYSEDYLDLIVEHDGYLNFAERLYNAEIVEPVDNQYAVIHAQKSLNPPLSISTYEYSTLPECLGLMDLSSASRSGVIRLREQPFLSLSGQGVLIGIVDTGIEYTNPIFKKSDGTTKIFSIWDQTIDTEDNPEGFYYGTEYMQGAINIALMLPDPYLSVPSKDENGHGTMLAGIAAGNLDIANEFTGIAPGSELVIVKLKEAKEDLKKFYAIPSEAIAYQSNDIMMGVQYLHKVADRLHRPLVILLGLGTNTGGTGVRGVLSQFLARIGNRNGFCVVSAAGNEGGAGHCYLGNVDPKVEVETVELRVGRDKGFTVELWGLVPNIYSIAIVSPAGEYIQRVPPRSQKTNTYKLLVEDTTIRVDYQLNEKSAGQQAIIITFFTPTPGVWKLEVYKEQYDTTGFMLKLPIRNFISDETFFLQPSPEVTVVNPSVTSDTLCVTAYDYVNNSIYNQASWGMESSFLTKPDIAAPGVDIIVPNLDQGFNLWSGTSLAAACAAGGAALILEWGIVRGNDSSLNGRGVRNFMIRGAERDPNMTYPNLIWGYGRMNLYQSFERLLRL